MLSSGGNHTLLICVSNPKQTRHTTRTTFVHITPTIRRTPPSGQNAHCAISSAIQCKRPNRIKNGVHSFILRVHMPYALAQRCVGSSGTCLFANLESSQRKSSPFVCIHLTQSFSDDRFRFRSVNLRKTRGSIRLIRSTLSDNIHLSGSGSDKW